MAKPAVDLFIQAAAEAALPQAAERNLL